MPDPERLLTPSDLSVYLGVPINTLYQWRHRGDGPPAVRVGRHLRYRSRDVEAWVDGRRADAAS